MPLCHWHCQQSLALQKAILLLTRHERWVSHAKLTCTSQMAPKAAVPPHRPADVMFVDVSLI